MSILTSNDGGVEWETIAISFVGGVGLIMVPEDDDGARDQILARAQEVGGPYGVRIDESLAAGNIDWKGPPVTDGGPAEVLSWLGPRRRHHQMGSDVVLGPAVWKNGRPYATAPGDVVGASFLGAAPNRTLTVIVNTDSAGGGPLDLGEVTWDVYQRPEGRDLSAALFDPVTAPNGWRLVATLVGPSDFNGIRWRRSRVWMFNESGTQASQLVPVNDPGDTLLRRTLGGPVPVSFLGTNNALLATNRLRLMSVDVSDGAATLNDEGVEPPIDDRQGVVTSFSCSFDAGIGTYSQSSETGLSGTRRVAVDYKGDSRVFATLGGGGSLILGSITSVFDTVDGSQNSVAIETNGNGGLELVAGSSNFRWDDVVATSISASGEPMSGGGTREERDVSLFGSGPTWLDLRSDVVVVPYQETSSSEGVSVSGTPFGGGSCTTQVDATVTQTTTNELHVDGLVAGALEVDYDHVEGVGPVVFSDPLSFAVAKAPGCCGGSPIGGSGTVIDRFWSLESFDLQDDNSLLDSFSRPTGAATDGIGNVVLSVETWAEADPPPSGLTPGPPSYLNFITGDDLQDVMNQVEHEEGPLGANTRAQAPSVKVI